MIESDKGIKAYRRKGGLTRRKLAEYIPVMIVTNLSLLLINTVDGIVAGNFVGPEAMSSISIFFPVVVLTSAFSALAASGIGTAISDAMGRGDTDVLAHTKSAGLRIMTAMTVTVGIAQIPLVWLLVQSYGLSKEMSVMIWQYAVGCMICTPLGIISTVGTYQLQIAGKMKVLMILSLTEGLCNLVFDLLFVAGLHMGVAGAGYGTACSNLVRCAATVIYMLKFTDFYKGDGRRVTAGDIKAILSRGVPDAAFILMLAFQNYIMTRIILHSFGEPGGVINGVCAFCLSLVNVLLFGIQGGMRPLMGLFVGADDKQDMADLMKQGALLVVIYAGIASLVIITNPALFYSLHGVHEIPDGGLLAVQLYTPVFVLRGFNFLLRLYFSNRQDLGFATTVTVIGNATLPVFAFIIASSGTPAPFIFLAYTCTEALVLAPSLIRYLHWMNTDRKEKTDDLVLYMTISKDDAAGAAEQVEAFADKNGIDKSVSYKTALCIEEMAAYIQRVELFSLHSVEEVMDSIRRSDLAPMVPSDLDVNEIAAFLKKSSVIDLLQPDISADDIIEQIRNTDLFSMLPPDIHAEEALNDLRDTELSALLSTWDTAAEMIIRFKGKNKALIITLDDGKCTALDKSEEEKELITGNYSLIKKIADKIEYQYILNMNYTKISIS